jgi:DNA topoisomerase III
LFNLTSLQREANVRFGFSAKTTLALAQSLYEKHKVLTYPRTDSRCLPEDYIDTVRSTLENLSINTNNYAILAHKILQEKWLTPNKRIFDNKKISDHFAIIPTTQLPKSGALSELEEKLYDLVVRRFLSVFYPAAEYLLTSRITTVNNHCFKTDGKVLKVPGWLAVYGKETLLDDVKQVVRVSKDETPIAQPVNTIALVTKPPARYTEATLLSAMEGAGKHLDDDELREVMTGKGLGTSATRASIIEGLVSERYLLREGRDFIPTAKACQLMTLLRGLGIEELTKPELTGHWEHQLLQMEQGKIVRQTFMHDIANMTELIVKRAKEYDNDTVPGDYVTLNTPCPHCGGTIKENYRRFACESCEFSITKIPGGRQFELDEIETLLQNKSLGPLSGFRSKKGFLFTSLLRIVPDTDHPAAGWKLEFDFGDKPETEEVDFSDKSSVGVCPKCHARVFEHGPKYLCEKSVGSDKSCDFSTGKVILEQEINLEQIQKLLAEGKTDLLSGFRSTRGHRLFKAFLVRQKNGKIAFEFEEKKTTPTTSSKVKSKSAESTDQSTDPTPKKRGRKPKTETSAAETTTPVVKTTRKRKPKDESSTT